MHGVCARSAAELWGACHPAGPVAQDRLAVLSPDYNPAETGESNAARRCFDPHRPQRLTPDREIPWDGAALPVPRSNDPAGELPPTGRKSRPDRKKDIHAHPDA